MVTLVIRASKSETLFDHMHELGTAFFCKVKDPNIYKVVYFSSNRQVFYEGPLTNEQLKTLREEHTEVTEIGYDKWKDELIIEE